MLVTNFGIDPEKLYAGWITGYFLQMAYSLFHTISLKWFVLWNNFIMFLSLK